LLVASVSFLFMRSFHPFGTLLTRIRSRRSDLTQAKLAELIGYDPAVIARMGRGGKDLFGPRSRERILAIVQGLINAGVLFDRSEADSLLLAANQQPLSSNHGLEDDILGSLQNNTPAGSISNRSNHSFHIRSPMKIFAACLLVDNQDKALRFYVDKLGFIKKSDEPDGDSGLRSLTVVSPDAPQIELELQLTYRPSARAWQKEQYDEGYAFMAFTTNDIQSEFTRLKSLGVQFQGNPEDHGHVIAVKFDDTCGNLISLLQFKQKR
jgi:catechol 2,3-dioxygenase-like lactoylglutathione lyase family enzyme